MSVHYQQIINNPIYSNCFILYKSDSKSCIIVDPGSEDITEIDFFVTNKKLKPSFILLTHEHFDHCWGADYFANKYNLKIICTAKCSERIKDSKKNLSLFRNTPFEILADTVTVETLNNTLDWEEYNIQFHYAGGHTDAGVFAIIGNFLITGDTLIPNMKTITKLLCGSKDELKISLEFLKKLKNRGLNVLPGHGLPFNLDDYNLTLALN